MPVSAPDPLHSRPTLAHRVEYLGFRLMAALARHLPSWIADGMSAALWRAIAPRLRRQDRVLNNLALALPQLTGAEREEIALKVWDNLGRTTMEALALDQIADDPEAIEWQLTDEARAVLEGDNPAIFVGLHAGNWEIPALAAEAFGKPLMGVYQKILNPLVDRDVSALRARFYQGGMHAKGAETVTRIRRGLSAGLSVAIMVDLRDAHGEYVPFFGVPVRSTTFPALLARLYRVPIVAIRATRIGPRRFRVDAVTLPYVESENRKADILAITEQIQAQCETWIRENPAQWMWGHNRWDR
jgi:Kdo2-lipid IVA lauroyltransferase/acyltransferase